MQKFNFNLGIGFFIIIFVGLFSLLLISIKSILTPFLLFVLLFLLFYFFREVELLRRLFPFLLLIFFVWIIQEASSVAAPFISALIIAYLLDPLVGWFVSKKIPRTISILLILLLFLSFLFLIIYFVIPVILTELSNIIDLLPSLNQSIIEIVDSLNEKLKSFGFNIGEKYLINKILVQLEDIIQQFVKSFGRLSSNFRSLITSLLNIILVPFLAFYFLKDFKKIAGSLKRLIPKPQKKLMSAYYEELSSIINTYFRGQLLICTILATMISIGLSIAGVRFALLIGILAGVLNIIPYIGATTAFLFAILITIPSPDPLSNLLKLVIIYLGSQMTENMIITPNVMGHNMKLSPVSILFSLFFFSHFLGFWGLFLAVPMTAVIQQFVGKIIRERYYQSDFYLGRQKSVVSAGDDIA